MFDNVPEEKTFTLSEVKDNLAFNLQQLYFLHRQGGMSDREFAAAGASINTAWRLFSHCPVDKDVTNDLMSHKVNRARFPAEYRKEEN